MTEEEARAKWCPMARAQTLVIGVDYAQAGAGGAGGKSEDSDKMWDKPNCLASGCMMWVPEGQTTYFPGGCGLVLHLHPLRLTEETFDHIIDDDFNGRTTP